MSDIRGDGAAPWLSLSFAVTLFSFFFSAYLFLTLASIQPNRPLSKENHSHDAFPVHAMVLGGKICGYVVGTK